MIDDLDMDPVLQVVEAPEEALLSTGLVWFDVEESMGDKYWTCPWQINQDDEKLSIKKRDHGNVLGYITNHNHITLIVFELNINILGYPAYPPVDIQ